MTSVLGEARMQKKGEKVNVATVLNLQEAERNNEKKKANCT